MKIVIIGGVAGGASTATRLRRLDESAEIILLERGKYVSFANCGLPYYVGNDIKDKDDLIVQTPNKFKNRYNIDVRVMNEALKIDKSNKIVKIKNLETNDIYEESYDKLVLSPGAYPIKPNMDGIDLPNVFTIRNIPDTVKVKEYINKNKPKTAVIVGGGYIGIEMAENLSKLGINVTIVELSDHLIGPLDLDMSSFVKNYITKKGIEVILSNGVKQIEEGKKNLNVILDDDNVLADMVIMSVGVKPDSILAKEAGLELNNMGSIVVNDKMQTSDKDIYALGDAVEITNFVTKEKGFIPLAGPANKQSRIVANNICNISSRYKGTQGTSIVKIFDMNVAATGINETVAKRLKLDYDKIVLHPFSHATYYPGSTLMAIKVIYEKNRGKILGAQIVGFDGVDKRIDIFATAIRASMTASDLTELELSYAPPFSSAKDPVNFAGYIIENTILDNIENVHFEDIESNIENEDLIILDVRTDSELKKMGKIENSIHIPVDELRERLYELDKNKKIIIVCYTGLRSYVAYRMLKNSGYTCYNLSGGYRLYKSIIDAKN